jgi:Na+/H+ antiporter NhaC
MAPWVMWRTGMYPFARQGRHLWVNLASSIVVLLVFLLFPMRVRLALERVEKHPGISAAVGTLAIVAVFPIAILLVLSIIGIPLVILEIAAVFVAIWIGKGAIGLLVGRRLYELISPNSTPSPLGALILGLIVVGAAEIVPVVGWAVTALVYLVGFGATILAFAREGYLRTLYARTPFGGGPPFGGPPMNRPA